MIHELRTYTLPDGRMPEVLSLFNEVLFDVFGRLKIKVVSFWTNRDASALVYVCEFDSEAAKAVAWEAFFQIRRGFQHGEIVQIQRIPW